MLKQGCFLISGVRYKAIAMETVHTNFQLEKVWKKKAKA